MKCYLCDNKSTSHEHVPAKCFFPKGGNINLITVPSCNIHNLDTSLDDEYLRNLIALTQGNNLIGKQLFINKGVKALENSNKKYDEIVRNPIFLNFIKNDDNTKNLTIQVDINRFDRAIKKIAYGLHFYKYRETWNKELLIGKSNFVTDNYEVDPVIKFINGIPKIRDCIVYDGANQTVFKYSFFMYEKKIFLTMKFYEYFEVWVIQIYSSNKASLL